MNKLLITTMLKFVLYDGDARIIHEGDLSQGGAHYHGITWDDDTVYVAAANEFKYIIRKFSKDLRHIGIIDDADLHSPHQIFWQTGKLYVTNTGLNRLEIYDGQEWDNVAWHKTTYDLDHINGLWSNGKQFYVSQYANRDEPRQPSSVRVSNGDFTMLDEIIIGPGIHNVYVEDSVLYSLVSSPPRIAKFDLIYRSLTMTPLSIKSGLVRGLARTKDHWYIGVARWETDKSKRQVADVVILQLNSAFVETNRIVLPQLGPVCDIRVIDEIDLAHKYASYQ